MEIVGILILKNTHNLQHYLDASTTWTVPATGDFDRLKPGTLSPSRAETPLVSTVDGNWEEMEQDEEKNLEVPPLVPVTIKSGKTLFWLRAEKETNVLI